MGVDSKFIFRGIEMTEVDLKSVIAQAARWQLDDLASDEIGSGLGTFLDMGRIHFHLEGRDLLAFVHGVIEGMVAGGATPEDGRFVTPDNPFGVTHFGADTPKEVADGILAAWIADGMPDPKWGDWHLNTARNRERLSEAYATFPPKMG